MFSYKTQDVKQTGELVSVWRSWFTHSRDGKRFDISRSKWDTIHGYSFSLLVSFPLAMSTVSRKLDMIFIVLQQPSGDHLSASLSLSLSLALLLGNFDSQQRETIYKQMLTLRQRWVVTNYIYFVTFTWVHFLWVTNTFREYLKIGTFTLIQVNFLWKKGTFTLFLWATLLSLLYLNAIK